MEINSLEFKKYSMFPVFNISINFVSIISVKNFEVWHFIINYYIKIMIKDIRNTGEIICAQLAQLKAKNNYELNWIELDTSYSKPQRCMFSSGHALAETIDWKDYAQLFVTEIEP